MNGAPLIAVTTSEVRASGAGRSDPTPESDPPRDEMVLGMRYLQALAKVGCLPVVVPPVAADRLEAFLDRVDGVCLSGGPDLRPDAYGAEAHPRLGPTEPELDRFELALAAAADRRGMPVLAICRGAQLLNVVRGGTLHQHLPDVVGTRIEHRQTAEGSRVTHPVRLERRSALSAVLGTADVQVNSFHHQAVDRLGAGLRIVGRAPDDVVEAFEEPGPRFVVGVQWHAESLACRPEQHALWAAFAEACGGPRVPALGRAA